MNTFQAHPMTEIAGAYMVLRKIYADHRGNFSEVGRDDVIPGVEFVQSNSSFSHGGTLRGLHIQGENPQGKLVTCVFGEILDVGIDLRPESPTFLKSFSLSLSWKRGESVYLPPGIAHGFLALSEYAVVNYNCTTYHDPNSDGGVNWKSEEIVDRFGRLIEPIISDKDDKLPSVTEYLERLKTHGA